MQIYLNKNGTKLGPYSAEQVHSMVLAGEVSPDDLGWRQGFSDWLPVYSLLGWLPKSPPPPLPRFAPVSVMALKPKRKRKAKEPVFTTFGLVLFGLGQMLVVPIITFCKMSYAWDKLGPYLTQAPALKNALLWASFGSVIFVAYGMVVGFAICSGNPDGRKIAKQFLLTRLVCNVLIEVIVLFTLNNGLPTEIAEAATARMGGVILAAVISFLFWWWYFTMARGVRTTYGPEDEEEA